MPRVVHFEIPADQPEKVLAFYERVFGWSFTKWDGPADYWLIATGEPSEAGINGGLQRRSAPGQPIVNTIDVPSVDDYITRITGAGGEIAVPKMAIPGVGWLAYFKDIEGNVIGIMQSDEDAA